MDDDAMRKPPAQGAGHEVGTALDALSVDELGHRIAILKDEIARLEAAIEHKTASRSAADSVFKF